MNMHLAIKNLLNKEMSRKEFIALVASALLSVLGITALINRFTGHGQIHEQPYGVSAYGGASSRNQR